MTEDQEQEPIPRLREDLRLLGGAIDSEYTLNDRRLNALLVFHAFLFAFFGVIVSADELYRPLQYSVGLGIGVFGMVSARISGISLSAGISRIKELKLFREGLLGNIPKGEEILRILGVNVCTKAHKGGVLPYHFYPVVLMIAWTFLSCLSVALLIFESQCLAVT